MKHSGFTLVELLVVLGISAILVGISGGVYFSFLKRGSIESEAQKIASVLYLARNQTLASYNKQSFGVHFISSTGEYILFPGAVFDSLNSSNTRFLLPSQIFIDSVEVQGGGNDVVFNRLSGATFQYGFVRLHDRKSPLQVRMLCINSSGVVETRVSCPENILEYSGGVVDGDLASFPSNAGWGDPAQSFTVGLQNISVREVQLYARKVMSNVSSVFLEIRSGNTVGTTIGRSLMVDSSSIATTSSWTSFVFPSPVLLLSSTQYFLRLRSLPDSTIVFSNATGTIYWAYQHAASSPPAYAGGDAWRYVGQSNNPTYAGERLGPLDQYDFSFRIFYGISPPPSRDSRHLEFDLLGLDGRGWSIQGASTLRLVFHNPGNPDTVANVPMASYFKNGNKEFDWEGSVNVNGDIEKLRAHTHYLDEYDTALSIHRDRRDNQKAVDISIDGKAIVSYAADGGATVGAYGGVMSYR